MKKRCLLVAVLVVVALSTLFAGNAFAGDPDGKCSWGCNADAEANTAVTVTLQDPDKVYAGFWKTLKGSVTVDASAVAEAEASGIVGKAKTSTYTYTDLLAYNELTGPSGVVYSDSIFMADSDSDYDSDSGLFPKAEASSESQTSYTWPFEIVFMPEEGEYTLSVFGDSYAVASSSAMWKFWFWYCSTYGFDLDYAMDEAMLKFLAIPYPHPPSFRFNFNITPEELLAKEDWITVEAYLIEVNGEIKGPIAEVRRTYKEPPYISLVSGKCYLFTTWTERGGEIEQGSVCINPNTGGSEDIWFTMHDNVFTWGEAFAAE